MEDNGWAEISLILLIIAINLGGFYGVYRLGRWMERKALTAALVSNLEGSYWSGYDDGQKNGEARCRNGLVH